MKITREILGTDVEIELTLSEMLNCREMMDLYDTFDMFGTHLFENGYVDVPSEIIERLSKDVVEEKDAFDANMGSNIFPAMEAVIRKNADELGKYKKDPYKLFEIEYIQTRKRTWTIRARNREEADLIFHIWRDNHMDRYDDDIADGDIDDTCGYLKEVPGNPDTAEIQSIDL